MHSRQSHNSEVQTQDEYESNRPELLRQLIKVLQSVKIDPKKIKVPHGKSFKSVSEKKINLFDKLLEEKLKMAMEQLSEKETEKRRRPNRSEQYFIHLNDRCAKCAQSPIVGSRFHALERPEHSLCEGCVKGDDLTKFVRVDRPQFDQDFVSHKITENHINQYIRRKLRESRSNSRRASSERKSKPLNFKAKVLAIEPSTLQVESLQRGQTRVTLVNVGDMQWPEDTELLCISGVTEGLIQKVTPLMPKSMRTFEIPIHAPKISGTYETVWRLATMVNGIRRVFGPKITVMLSIAPKRRENEPRRSVSGDRNLFCTQDVLSRAKEVRKALGGDLRSYIEFIKQFNLERESPDDIVALYLQTE